MTAEDLMNLCFSCLIDGGREHTSITLDEAEYTLRCWKEENNELSEEIEGLTAKDFLNAWNSCLNQICTKEE